MNKKAQPEEKSLEQNVLKLPKPNMVKEEDVLKFYYMEDTGEYIIGKRCGTMYYGTLNYVPKHDTYCISYIMSRYFPWGQEGYSTEPKEILFEDWLTGFRKQIIEELKDIEESKENNAEDK